MLQQRKSLIKRVDLIVVGAGLAGSAMAWNAHWRGMSVAVVDRAEANSSSRVAAGLVTPITGTRAAASWKWDQFYPVANEFYRRVEVTTSASIWRVEPAVRFYRDEQERSLYQSKWIDTQSEGNQDAIRVESNSKATLVGFKSPNGFCEFSPAARLLTVEYLDATRRYFELNGEFHALELRCEEDLVISSSNSEFPVCIPVLGLEGNRIVFCQGVGARDNRYFEDLPLHPARGDILTIESRSVRSDRVLHHDAWAVPIGDHRFLIGATYDRAPLHSPNHHDEAKANQFRNELMRRWESMVEGDFVSGEHAVLDQRWAVRPASYDRHPLIGPHDLLPFVFCLNGLGSKGTLMAPRLADLLIASMHGVAIDRYFLWSRRR